MAREAWLSRGEARSTHYHARTLAELCGILDPRYDVAFVLRGLEGEDARALRALAVQALACRFDGDARALDAATFLSPGITGRARDFLAEDVPRLARAYAELFGQRHVKVALTTVVDDACRKFHADYVGLRMLCTYAGAGTEVLDEAGLDRSALSSRLPFEEANPHIRGTAALFRAGEGDVLVLKGCSHPGNGARGAVHRSPPIAALGARRLVLKIDAADCGC